MLCFDYGSLDTLPWSDLRPLETKYGKGRLAPMAQTSRLSFVRMYEGPGGGKADEYAAEAQDRFRDYEGRKLIANVDYREPAPGGPIVHLTLYDPELANTTPEACLNVDLVREGYALVDKKVPYVKARPTMTTALEAASSEARRLHRGEQQHSIQLI